MAKVKRYLTEQEDKLLSELRSLQKGSITQNAIDAAVQAVREQRGIDTAVYARPAQSIEDFMRETFGSGASDEYDGAPADMVMIDFN